jgi:hypothetical protein
MPQANNQTKEPDMSSFRVALTNLSLLRIRGIRNNFDIDELPASLTAAHLPALLVLPLELEKERLFRERKESLQTVTFSGNARTAYFSLTHLLLAAPAERGLGMRSHLPQLVDLIDAYLAGLARDLTLGDALLTPARVGVEPGLTPFNAKSYYGCAFRHTWLMEIQA